MQHPTNDDAPFAPDWVSPPGDTILDLIEHRGWSRAEFASRVGLDEAQTDSLISGGFVLDAALAESLAQTFGSTAAFWLRREANFRSGLAMRQAPQAAGGPAATGESRR